ncbi:MAG: DUF5010 domain-containing protein [Pirellulales bacterium]|nr:DUF5010 domain-containing protein [Pirellulales bacterium]
MQLFRRYFFLAFLMIWILSGSLVPIDAESGEPPSSRVVATHYFYWYRWPDKHFNQPNAPGHEGHYHHFKNPEAVSYESPAWHRTQFAAMRRVGIDIALPVYWGAPGAYERDNIRFSRDGLGPMVQALRELGNQGVQIGLFYDTSTLQNGVRGLSPPHVGADLTSPAGQDLFCNTIIEFFMMIPPDLWGRVDRRPLVVLYSAGFASKWDRDLGKILARRFEKQFPGEKPFLVADSSWRNIGQDRTTSWGAALTGPKLFPGVAQIGPGYNDTPVPGRTTPIREREDGNFYRHSWRMAVQHQPQLILLETWNEMHEGTEICETIETGTQYLDITAEWIHKFKTGNDPGPDILLEYTQPRPRVKTP